MVLMELNFYEVFLPQVWFQLSGRIIRDLDCDVAGQPARRFRTRRPLVFCPPFVFNRGLKLLLISEIASNLWL